MAIITRCRMPPDSSCGNDLSRPGSTPTRSSSSAQRRRRSFAVIPGRCATKTSSSWARTLITGLREFIAP